MLQKIQETTKFIQGKTKYSPKIGIILGTGLGGLVNEIENQEVIDYKDIPNFPVSTVKGHHGRLIFGLLGGKEVMAMQGRFHYYEGYEMQILAFPIRVMKFLGVEQLIVSNAAGGINPAFKVGDIMFIKDHINLMSNNPLIGPNDDEIGPRFPDMSESYDRTLLKLAKDIAAGLNISVHEGVYAAVTGPTFETPAEYRFIRTIGADAVGMSTVPEVIVARHAGMKCFALSVITDLGGMDDVVPVTHEEVIEAASKSEPLMTTIIKKLLAQI